MNSRNFPTVDMKLFRGDAEHNDTGYIQQAMTAGNPGATRNLRGVERNTARGVKEAPMIMGLTPVEHAPATDAPPVDPFDTYEDED
jgi:hypothetical protein